MGVKAAVLGKPVEHSLSPVLHMAAYAALGLTDWSYERIEMDAAGLPRFVDACGPEWAGFSVTMPGKRAALDFATTATPRALAAGAANTLVRHGSGWSADCTDVDGVTGALRCAGGFTAPADSGGVGGAAGAGGFAPAAGPGEFTTAAGPDGSGGAGGVTASSGLTGVVLGAGGTAAATVVAFAALGIGRARLVVRDPARATETLAAAERAGIATEVITWADADFRKVVADASVLVSTVPPAAVAEHAEDLAAAECVLDVIYHPWPTPLAEAVAARGGRIATGLDMLLHQAFGQVEQFTGQPAPREAMRDALRSATGNVLPLPLD